MSKLGVEVIKGIDSVLAELSKSQNSTRAGSMARPASQNPQQARRATPKEKALTADLLGYFSLLLPDPNLPEERAALIIDQLSTNLDGNKLMILRTFVDVMNTWFTKAEKNMGSDQDPRVLIKQAYEQYKEVIDNKKQLSDKSKELKNNISKNESLLNNNLKKIDAVAEGTNMRKKLLNQKLSGEIDKSLAEDKQQLESLQKELATPRQKGAPIGFVAKIHIVNEGNRHSSNIQNADFLLSLDELLTIHNRALKNNQYLTDDKPPKSKTNTYI